MVGLIDAVVEEAAAFLSATSATLFILDRENGVLWARRRGLPGTPNAGALQVNSSKARRPVAFQHRVSPFVPVFPSTR